METALREGRHEGLSQKDGLNNIRSGNKQGLDDFQIFKVDNSDILFAN